MKTEEAKVFLKRFQPNFDLVRLHKILGIQLRLYEKPGQTIANYKRGTK